MLILNYLSHYFIAETQGGLDNILNPFQSYTIPLDEWVNNLVNFLVDNFRPIFQAISLPISGTLEIVKSTFLAIPPLIFLIIITLLVWQLAGRKIAIYSFIALIIIGFCGAWEASMVSLSLILTAVIFCMLVGIPLGIACAVSDRFNNLLRPFLDAMQTLPTFVYLVPVVMLFGIGEVSGIIATFVFSVPPLIRLTNLGIRQVSPEAVEAALAFGSTPQQVLLEVQIPLALPTILAGTNQAILLALSMSVVTSMIGVEGLGQMVLQGLGRLNVGLAAVGGLGIVLIAVMLDRITQSVSQGSIQSWQERGPIGWWRSRGLSKREKATLGISIVVALLVGATGWQLISQTDIKSTEDPLPGKGIVVRPTSDVETYSVFITEVVNIGLEKLGYQVKSPKQLNIPAMHIAVSNGDLDFTGAHWEVNQREFFDNNGGGEKLEKLGTLVSNSTQGYKIDKKTAQEYNITNLSQLQDPKIAQIFDSDGDGKANLIGCTAGWICERVIDHHLQAYGLEDTVEQIQGDYSALLADTLVRYRQGKPILFYGWKPHWFGSVLKEGEDVEWLNVPFTSLVGNMENFTEKETSFNGKNFGIPIDNIKILANKKFVQDNPVAQRFFEQIEIPLEDVNIEQEKVQNGENKPVDIRRHAEEWIASHQGLFDDWLEVAQS
ncbi:MAG: glycine betaine/L-proline ABC transporter substrate-binding protein ProX [Okeania sp. SIO3I5]|uniref:glycine betaine/L-proline ABC transporter substrate-binding protein ProX n=1 Tax=Okeania sp. SIO3I5 TaxID=2607805 RepID=UPI0013BC8E8A|nr:glycine betaine/L-proline ABC transporter substrate-binding protein ProX [Okeania sp. SIO3I5]NEQ38998.1 glycine betaine/L-proline ABC transporter substrate-binding protein ProX [Okeania sp. SIO3I5]